MLQDSSLSTSEIWIYGLLTSVGLSSLGFVAAILLVLLGKAFSPHYFTNLIKFLFALACGSLLGDATIHILSEAYASQNTKEWIVSLIFLCSLFTFMVIENLFIYFGITHKHWTDDEGAEHHHHNHSSLQAQPSEGLNESLVPQAQQQKSCLKSFSGKGTAGYLNLIGSFIHNFVDGLSIGLAFTTGDKTVITPLVIAIFAHEIPRELGDVAILLENGFDNCQAIMSNGLINMLSVVGAVAGLATVGLSDNAKEYIMVFVAGNFIYIASDIWRNLFKSKALMNILQFFGLAIGVGAMFYVKMLEGDDEMSL